MSAASIRARSIAQWWLVLPVLLLTVACDQTTKRIAAETLQGRAPQILVGGALELRYSENAGAFLGLGSELGEKARFWVFTVGVGALLAIFGWKLLRASGRWELVGWAFVVGGGVGNLIDRLLRDGRVIDFLRVGIGELRTGVFNVADAAIVLGLVFLFVSALPITDELT